MSVTPDPYKYFRIEAREILDQLGQSALDLDKGGAAAEGVGRLLRLAHTLKGAARVVRLPAIADLAHALEDLLAPDRDTTAAVPRERIDRLLTIVDQIGDHVAKLQRDNAPAVNDGATRDPAVPPELPVLGFRPELEDLDTLLSGILEAYAQLGVLRPRVEDIRRGREAATVLADWLARRGGSGGTATNERALAMAGELSDRFGGLERELAQSVEKLDRDLQHVREAAERLRLAPASALFSFLELAVRDAVRTLGKDAVFTGSGGDVRVDSAVLSIVQGALLHVVRNAVAHGIEAPAHRVAAGKAAAGRVSLRVSQRGRMISFVCEDDGAGVDLPSVRRHAQLQGKLGETDRADADTLCRLLLDGGISTSAAVTSISGRGIGLDVVREAVDRLGGSTTLTTAPGRGTTMAIVVPVTAAAFQGLLIEDGDNLAAIPLDAVRGAVLVAREEILGDAQSASVRFGDEEIVLAPWPTGPSHPAPHAPARARASAVVIRGRHHSAALVVDRVVGTTSVLMRPLPEFAAGAVGVAGVALDAIGNPLLVFDPEMLVEHATGAGRMTGAPPTARVPILVIDDSLTTRTLEQSILESAGYEVALATSAEEGLDKARRSSFALFLVDVEMPGMNGFQFIEQIRADPMLRETPAILVTSRNAPEDRQRGRDVGAQGYVVKSEFDQGALLERIRELVS